MGKLDDVINRIHAAAPTAGGEPPATEVMASPEIPGRTPPSGEAALSTVTMVTAKRAVTLSSDVLQDCEKIQRFNFNPTIEVTRRMSLGEEFKKLRTNIVHMHERDRYQTFMLTSSRHAEGKTTTLVSLARFMGELNDLRVCIVDCDMRRPRVRTFSGLENIKVGLDDVLERGEDLTRALQYSMEDNLAILPCRRGRSNAAELLDHPRMDAVIDILRRDFDLILFDSPPVVSTTDPIVLGSRIDAVMVAVKTCETQRAQLSFVMRQLGTADINFVGLVLTHHREVIPRSRFFYRYVYYHDYYGYYYYQKDPDTGEETKKERKNSKRPSGSKKGLKAKNSKK